jgi:hypothetical protein
MTEDSNNSRNSNSIIMKQKAAFAGINLKELPAARQVSLKTQRCLL